MFHLLTLPTSLSPRISSHVSAPEQQWQNSRHPRTLVRTLHPHYPAPLPLPTRPPRLHLQLRPRPHQYPLPSRRSIRPCHDRSLRRRHRTTIYSQPYPCKQNPHRSRHRHTVYRLHPGAEAAAAADAASIPLLETASGHDHRDAHNALRGLAYWTARGGFEVWH